MSTQTVLILGGTAQARSLAHAIATQTDFHPLTSLAGVTRAPLDIAGDVRVGGFGGAEGLLAFLRTHNFAGVIDATHPFAARISEHVAQACHQAHVPRLHFDRVAWTLPPNTDAIFVPDAHEAANLLIRTSSQSAFLTIGRKDLSAFEGLEKTRLLVRMMEPPSAPLSLNQHHIITARPPFDVADEVAIMRQFEIDTLVTKASGGAATSAKIEAAEQVRARIILIRRPLPPEGERVFDLKDALTWLNQL